MLDISTIFGVTRCQVHPDGAYLRLGLSVVERQNIVEEPHLLWGQVNVERLCVGLEMPMGKKTSVQSLDTICERDQVDRSPTHSIFLPPMMG